MGMFSGTIRRAYAARNAAVLTTKLATPPLSISSPWSPQTALTTWAIDDALGGLLDTDKLPLTRDVALRVPGVKRAHGIVCTQLASIPLFVMNDAERVADQPEWLTNSRSGVAPYHRMYGAASDWFFHGWACFGFTADKTDCLHIPYGMWNTDPDDGTVRATDERIPAEYQALMVAVPLGYGENGLLVDGADTIRESRNVEAAYQQRLENPIPLTVMTIDAEHWDGSTPEERAALIDEWSTNRKKSSTAAHPAWMSIDMPGQVATDLYETGRNAVRLDIANHTATPASLLEGVRQGGSGGGTDIRYTGVQNGAGRAELWEFGQARRMLLAFEARMSLDDVCDPGLSIRGDLTSMLALPEPTTDPTSKD